MSAGWPWDALGLTAPAEDARGVKRAYAARLKQIDPAADPDGFQTLRRAYETASAWLDGPRRMATPPSPVAPTAPRRRSRAAERVDPPAVETSSEPEVGPAVETAPEVVAAPAPPDTARLAALQEAAAACIDEAGGVKRWRRILNDPLLLDVALDARFERWLRAHLLAATGHGETPWTPDAFFRIPRDAVAEIEARYDWFSDMHGRDAQTLDQLEWLRVAMVEQCAPQPPRDLSKTGFSWWWLVLAWIVFKIIYFAFDLGSL